MIFHFYFFLKETDSIVNQMMNVAEYLGWDVSELRPVIHLISTISFDSLVNFL